MTPEEIEEGKQIISAFRAKLNDLPEGPDKARLEGKISKVEAALGASSSQEPYTNPEDISEGFVGPTAVGTSDNPTIKANRIKRLQDAGQTPIGEFQDAQDHRVGSLASDVGVGSFTAQSVVDAAKGGNLKKYLGVDSPGNALRQLNGTANAAIKAVPLLSTALELPGEGLKRLGAPGILPALGDTERQIQNAPNPDLANATGMIGGTMLTAGAGAAGATNALGGLAPGAGRAALSMQAAGKLQAPTQAIAKGIGMGVERYAPKLAASAPNLTRVGVGAGTGATVAGADAFASGRDPLAAAKEGALYGASFSLPEALYSSATNPRTVGGRRTAEYVENSQPGGLYRDPEFIKLPESKILSEEAKTNQERMKGEAASKLEQAKQQALEELSPVEEAASAFKKRAMDAKNARLNKFEDNSRNYLEQEKVSSEGTIQRVQDEGMAQVESTKAQSDKWLAERQRRLEKVTTGRKQNAQARQDVEILGEQAKTQYVADEQQQQISGLNKQRMTDEKTKYGEAKDLSVQADSGNPILDKTLADELNALAATSKTGEHFDRNIAAKVKEVKKALFPGGDEKRATNFTDLVKQWVALKDSLPATKTENQLNLLKTLEKAVFRNDPSVSVSDSGTVTPGHIEQRHKRYAETSSNVEDVMGITKAGSDKSVHDKPSQENAMAKTIENYDKILPSHKKRLRDSDGGKVQEALDPVIVRKREEAWKVEEAKKRFFDSIQSDEFRAKDVMGRSKDIAKRKELEAKSVADERVSSVKLGSEKDLADKKHNVSLAKRRIQESEDAKIAEWNEQSDANVNMAKAEGQAKVKSVESQSAQ